MLTMITELGSEVNILLIKSNKLVSESYTCVLELLVDLLLCQTGCLTFTVRFQ